MTKILKIIGNTFLILMEIVLIFIIAFAFLIRTSQFQTYLANKGAIYFSKVLQTKVSIGKIDIAFLDRIYFDNLYIEDQHQDTLGYIHEFFVNFNLEGVAQLNFNIDEVKIHRAVFNLKRYKNEENLNLQFLIDAFKTDKPKKDINFKLNVSRVDISNSHFTFKDENKELTPNGVDFTDLDTRNIKILARNVVIEPGRYQARFKTIAFVEKSGFQLNQLTGNAVFSDVGLDLKDASIKTDQSDIHLQTFKLLSNSLSDFSSFVDSVKLESQFTTSYVSLRDVSYFAPQLMGMDEIVELTGNTHDAVTRLWMRDINLKFGKESELRGDFYLPDFKKLNKENIHQELDYFRLNIDDLTQVKLPDSASTNYIQWPQALVNIKKIEGYNLSIDGELNDLNVRLDKLNSNLGNFVFKDEFRVKSDTSFTTLAIFPKSGNKEQIEISNLIINKIIPDKNIGNINGYLGFNSVKFDKNGIKASNINGILNKTKLYGYTYDYMILDHVDYTFKNSRRTPQNQAEGHIYIRDENFDLSFTGFISIGNYLEMNAKIDIECAMLEELHPIFENRGELITSMNINAKGKNFNDFKGNFIIDSLFYQEGEDTFQTANFYSFIERNALKDSVSISSEILDATIYGLIDYSKIGKSIKTLLARTFPAFDLDYDEMVEDRLSEFIYDVTVNNVNDLLSILYPSVKIAEKTHIQGNYNGERNMLALNLTSDYLAFESIRFNNIQSNQEISEQELTSLIDIESIKLYDTLAFTDVHFTGLAIDGGLDSQLLFDDPSGLRSNIQWNTDMTQPNTFDFEFYPSYIALNGNQWQVNKKAHINYSDGVLRVDSLKLEYDNQYISADGALSKSIDDRMFIDVMDLNLSELAVFIDPGFNLSGVINASGYATTPLTDLRIYGEATVKSLHVNKTEVGDVGFGANYESTSDKMDMFGDIFYRDVRTFHFDGFYALRQEDDQHLNFDMQFRQTDIAVVNEFLDPDVIKDLRGKINGDLKLRGSLKEPLLTGKVDVSGGMLNLAILGANMYFDGKIESVKDGIYINQMPLRDEEGNTGFITGSLFHDNFKDLLFEVVVNLKEDPVKRMPGDRSKPLPLDRFLVMNTTYDIDNAYYGRAYITGMATISGYADNLSIIVNATTKRGTKVVIPLYGPTTIEDDGFITFKKSGMEEDELNKSKLDLTGVDLQLNFDVTDDAEVKLIFDEKVGDEISGRGEGQIRLAVDKYNELAMEGTFTVSNGFYNFVIGPYKQKFNIAPGGTVQWDGNPIEPNLNINAYYKTTTNLSVVMPDVIESQPSNNEEVYSYMTIVGSVKHPRITFDIAAPNASEAGKAVISRIRSNPSELNKQFFSLVISKSLIPLTGQMGSNSGAFLDIASQQINNVLNNMADGYRMNVDLENDDYTGQFSGQFGVSKSFLDDRLLVSGSFGVGTRKTESGGQENLPNQNTFLGDVKIEYLLNEKGSFRMNAFNKSNNDYLLQAEGRGHYTQGVGISYKENFYTVRDFKLMQFFANIFRKRENWVRVRDPNERRIPIPDEYLKKSNAVIEDE